jgi:acylphosphatase
MPAECHRWLFAGRVQGVGFRATTHWLARGFAVRGWVRNRIDGRVEVAACGAPDQLDGFREAIQQTFADNIRTIDEAPAPVADDVPEGFRIRYD